MLLSESESSLALYKKCADFKDRQTKTIFSLKVDNDLHFASMYLLEQGQPSEANDPFLTVYVIPKNDYALLYRYT